jgi:hypothetical protein
VVSSAAVAVLAVVPLVVFARCPFWLAVLVVVEDVGGISYAKLAHEAEMTFDEYFLHGGPPMGGGGGGEGCLSRRPIV